MWRPLDGETRAKRSEEVRSFKRNHLDLIMVNVTHRETPPSEVAGKYLVLQSSIVATMKGSLWALLGLLRDSAVDSRCGSNNGAQTR